VARGALPGAMHFAGLPYELFSATEILGRMVMERILAGLSIRRYPVGLEPVGTHIEQTATATSKSAVSRQLVAQTELSGLDLVTLMI